MFYQSRMKLKSSKCSISLSYIRFYIHDRFRGCGQCYPSSLLIRTVRDFPLSKGVRIIEVGLYLFWDIWVFVMYYIYGISGPSLLIESTDSIIHYKYPNISNFVKFSKCQNQNLQPIVHLTRPRSFIKIIVHVRTRFLKNSPFLILSSFFLFLFHYHG